MKNNNPLKSGLAMSPVSSHQPSTSDEGLDALHENFLNAVRTSDFKRVKGMLDRGLDPEFSASSGSPLHLTALRKGPVALAMASLLIDAGSNVNSKDATKKAGK